MELRAKSLKDGFAAELESRKVTLANCKNELETLYAQRLDELSGKPDLAAKVDSAIRGCDAAVTSYAGTMKSIKLAIESCFNILDFDVSTFLKYHALHGLSWVHDPLSLSS